MMVKAPGSGISVSSTLTSWVLPSVMWMKLGIGPRRSNRVCSLTAPLVFLKRAQGKRVRQRSMVVESSA